MTETSHEVINGSLNLIYDAERKGWEKLPQNYTRNINVGETKHKAPAVVSLPPLVINMHKNNIAGSVHYSCRTQAI